MAQLKDLLVLGASRFLNIIHGSIDGNAATADEVNHTLTISTPNGTAKSFTGAEDVSVSLTASDFGLESSTRFVGEAPDIFGQDDLDNRYSILAYSSTHAIPITDAYNTAACSGNGTSNYSIGGKDYHYYLIPQIGDIIKVGSMELICTGLGTGITGGKLSQITVNSTNYTKFSRWAILGNNEVWNTY